MPEVTISIGGRDFAVACQEGEEQYLHAAARMLDTEASALAGQAGRLPESRMLLMAGLMLADKAAGIEEQLKALEARVGAQEAELETLRNTPAPEAPEPMRVEVLPEGLEESLAQMVQRAEYIAATVEEKTAGVEG
ncbi:cell division protein ZapA [Psychromarinibacter sp. C21-152]|uniref:Cell division protein ZapA n=1 Tax=Psychromarinibacter sediminicola TaxID=3033385 RepID=A0AAE3NTM6_9RHOB|nr:cell division protein ZapA [Psychromarinibacter sediminicola]MDF0601439.1 cell division protein ZapA [Psychromarinibacter sediminicola]